MVHLILFGIAIALTLLFFLFAKYASNRQNRGIERKTSGCFQQIILRLIIAGIGFGLIFSKWGIQKAVFITPRNGYDMRAVGISLFAAIGLITVIVSLFLCVDYILFPRSAGKKTGNPRNFHLGFKLRPKLMTGIFFVSICFVLLDLLSYTYYKTGGEIVIREEWGLKTTYYLKSDIKEVNINSYTGGKGGLFKELIITFSDGRVILVNNDSEGSKKFLSEWQGDIKMTHEGKEV